MAKLTGKVAVVTGASKGIGAGTAKALAAEGAAVVVNYASSKEGADAVVDAIVSSGGKAVAVKGDVSRSEEANAIIDTAIHQFGRLDVLVNNSGVYDWAKIEEVTEENYRRQFDVNVLGPLLTTKAASPHLSEGGSVINISSSITSLLPADSAVYSGTKGALDAITGVLAKELGIGGLGHLALQYLSKWGCEVTAISSSRAKEAQARELGASRFIATGAGPEDLAAAAGSFDFILSTVAADLPWDAYLAALRPQGRLCIVGVPAGAIAFNPFSLLPSEKVIAGGIPGSLVETAQMLDFTARHGIKPIVHTFPMADVNDALDHVRHGRARYRAVLVA